MPRARIFRIRRVSLLLYFAVGVAHAATHEVRSAKEVESLIESRRFSPGDSIVWADGEFALSPLAPADVGVSFLGGGSSALDRDRSHTPLPDVQKRTAEVFVGIKAPGELLDLSCWKLTLPVDTDRPVRPDEINQPELKSFVDQRYFFVNEKTKSVVFRAHCGGFATKGSKYPRCELRETNDRDDTLAAWSTEDGRIHKMIMTAAFTQLPPVKNHVVCAQIHDADDDVLMVRLEGQKLFVERNDTADVLLEQNYELGTPFELKIQAGDGRIHVWHNGHLKMSWKQSLTGCYFKAGCYTQSNTSKGDTADSFGEVEISQLQVSHQSQP